MGVGLCGVIGTWLPNCAMNALGRWRARRRIAFGRLLGQPERSQTHGFCSLGRTFFVGFRGHVA
jgi:hypothetical protein